MTKARSRRPVLGLDAGLNRFTWDFRYAGSTDFPGMVLWSAGVRRSARGAGFIFGAGYRKCGETQTQTFHITEDPRSTESQADLQANSIWRNKFSKSWAPQIRQ